MKKITDIKPQLKNPKRVNLYLDGEFYMGLDRETVMRYRLKIGTETDEKRLGEIVRSSEVASATSKALSFISSSVKTEKQIKDYLIGKGYSEPVAEETIRKMKGYGYIDDGAYAAEYTKSYSSKKGKRLIAMELRRKGVSEEDMAGALENAGDEAENALSVAKKYMKNKVADKANLMKCYKHLLSKGFDFDAAKRATEKFGSGDED